MINITHTITFLGLLGISLYCITKIFKFFNISESVYGPYLFFFLIIMISTLILPNNYPKV